MKLTLVLTALAVATVVLAGPVHRRDTMASGSEKCATRCSGSETKYSFETGHTYQYTFTSHTDVHIPNMDKKHGTNITQKAQIDIAKLAPCEYQMMIKSVRVEGADVPAEFSEQMTKYPTRFSFDDGQLSTVCADNADNTWVLNLKRGILSTLQNAFQADEMDISETEVSGKCRSRYSHHRHGDDTIYSRQRHSHSCKGHHNMHGAMRSHPYEVESENNEAKYGEQHHQCTHRISSTGILKEARCTETQKFTPLTDEQYSDNVIQSTVRSHWKLVDDVATVTVEQIQFGERKSIVYDASAIDYAFQETGARDVQKALAALCDSSNSFVTKSTPSEFVRLVETLRNLNDNDWAEFDQHKKETPGCENGMKFMRDALAMCGTEKCVQQMIDLLKSGELSQREQYEFYAALAFVPKVTLGMIRPLLKLVEGNKHGLLGVSSMVHTYCAQENQRSCEEEDEVQRIIDSLNDLIGRNCELKALNAKQAEEKILALKALGNIGRLTDAAQTTIEKCFMRRENPIAIRVAAAQATRRTPCEAKVRHHIRKIYDNQDEEVELRINAFLSLMKCADEKTLQYVVDSIEQEQVHQVGSFVTSYLKTRRYSSDPHQKENAQILKSMPISSKFDHDSHRYSTYSEMGTFSSMANTGGHVEQGNIYVPGSHTPRAVYANMTTHLFGHSVNFFEMGARAEGLDHFIESQIGTEGIFTNPGSEFDRVGKEDSAEYLEQQKAFESRPHYESDESFALSMYVRVFGNEILYMGFDDPNILDTMRAKQDWKALTDFLAKQREFNYKHNSLFMDITKALPNAGGLPVFLQITGASSVNMAIDGKTDLTQALTSSPHIDIDWTVKPSMAIELSTNLYINVAGAKSGFRLLSRVHSSTAMNAQMQVRNGKSLKTVLGLPQDSMKLIDFEVIGFGLVNNNEVAVVNNEYYADDEYCTPERVNKLLGIKSCMGLSMPKEGRLFPARAWLGIDKVDKKLSTYEMQIHLREGRGIPYPRELSIDTPGSEIDRKVSIKYDQNGDKHIFEAHTPSKNIKLEGDVDTLAISRGKEYKGNMTLIIDNDKQYKMLTVVKRIYDESKARTELHAKAHGEQNELIELRAHMEVASFSKLDIGAELKGIEETPRKAALRFMLPQSGYTGEALFDLIYQCASYDNKLEARYENNQPNYKLKLLADVKPGPMENFEPMTMRFDVEHLEQQHADRVEIKRKLELVKSLHPQSNFITSTHELTSATHRKYGMDLKYGKELTQEASVLLEGHYKESGKHVYEGQLVVPQLSIENKIVAEYESTIDKAGVLIDANAKLTDMQGNNKKTISLHHAAKMMQRPFEWVADLKANVEGTDMDYRLYKQLIEKADSTDDQRKWTSKVIVQWAPEQQVKFDGDVLMQQRSMLQMHYDLQGKAKLTGVKLNGQDEFDVHKTIKMLDGSYQYTAKLSHADKSYYDINVDYSDNYDNEKKLNTHIKSHMIDNLDYELDVKLLTPSKNNYNIESILSRGGKQYAQMMAKCVQPASPNAEHRLQLNWDLDTEKKEALVELKHEDNGKELKFFSTVMANVNQKEQKIVTTLQRQQDEQGMPVKGKLDIVHTKQGKKMVSIELGGDRSNKQENSIKVYAKYQCQDPEMTKRDVEIHLASKSSQLKTGDLDEQMPRIVAEYKDNINSSNNMRAEIATSGKHSDSTGLMEVNYLADLELFQFYKLKSDGYFKGNRKTGIMEYTEKQLLQWASDKKIERSVSIQLATDSEKVQMKMEETVNTPFEAMRQYAFKCNYHYDMVPKNERIQSILTSDFEWNNERVYKFYATNNYTVGFEGLKLTQHQTKLTTNVENIGELKLNYLNEVINKNGLDTYELDSAIEWGQEANKLHFRREYGADSDKARYLALWRAKIADKVDTKARYDYQKTDTAHRIETSLKRSAEQYQLIGEFDDAKNTGTVKIVAPNTPIESVAIKVQKKGEDEYELSSESNRGARVSGIVKLNSAHMRAHLKLDGIEMPMEIQAEMKDPRSNEVIGKLVIVKNYNTEATAERMGMTYAKRVSKGANAISTTIHSLTMHLSKREPHFELRQSQVEQETHYAIVSQLNRLSDRAPTKLLARIGEQKYELELVDAALANPLILSLRRQMDSTCPDFHQRQDRCRSEVVKFEIYPPYAKSKQDRIEVNIYAVALYESASSSSRAEGGLFALEIKQMGNDLQQVYYMQGRRYITYSQDIYMPTDIEMGTQVLRQSKLNKYAVRATAPKGQEPASLTIQSPSGRQSLEIDHVDGEYRWSLVSSQSNKPSYTLAYKMEDKRGVIELRRTPTSDIIYHASAGLKDKRTFEEETYHIDLHNKKHQDTFVKVWLETDNLLKVRLHAPPASWANLISEAQNIDYSSTYNSNEGFVADLMHSKRRAIESMKKIEPEMNRLVDSWNEQQIALREDVGSAADLVQMGNDYVEFFVNAYYAYLDQISATLDEWQQTLHIVQSMQESAQSLVDGLQQSVKSMSQVIHEIVQSLTTSMQNAGEQINQLTQSITELFSQNDVITAIKEKWTEYIEYICEQLGLKEKQGFFSRYTSAVKSKLGFGQQYTSSLMEMASVRRLYATIEPAIDELASVDITRIIEKTLEYFEELGSSKTLREYLPKVEYASKEQGQIEFALPMPVRASSLEDLVQQVMSMEQVKQFVQRVQKRLQEIFETDGKISDEKWQRVGNAPSPSQIGASYEVSHESSAHILGKQIVTFDGKAYGVQSDCDYILARDYYQNKFTIIGNFESSKGLKEISLRYKKHTITINTNGDIKVDGEKILLPYQHIDSFSAIAYVKVIRTDVGVKLSTFDNIVIECIIDKALCSVSLPGNYYGHSNGLLGSNDLEHSNDFNLADNDDNEDVARFADQWLVGGSSCKTTALAQESTATDAQKEQCDEAFRYRRSELRSCFSRVAPRAFHQLCLNGDFCSSVLAYERACRLLDVDVNKPSQCVRCENPNKASNEALFRGDTADLKAITANDADVVLVVEERPCMRFVSEKVLTDVIPISSENKRHAGNMYGVIGYGGEQVHNEPHFHTCNGNTVQCRSHDILSAFNTLEFEPQSATYEDKPIDPLWAIDYAVRHYPWRPAAAKVIVLLTCSECGSKVDYYNLQAEMLSQNVQLFVYTKELIQVEEQPTNLEIIGYSPKSMFTNRGENVDLRRSLLAPHDSCTVLAQELNGTVFSVYDGESSPIGRSRQINSERLRYPKCQICACDESTAPRTNCVSCQVPMPVSLSQSESFFNIPYVKLRNSLKKTQEQMGGVPNFLL